jgi:hypothetical protein
LKNEIHQFLRMGRFPKLFIFRTIGSHIEVAPGVSTTFHGEHESDEFERMGRTAREAEGNDIPEKCIFST